MMEFVTLIMLVFLGLDLVALAVFLGFLWLAHKEVRRKAAEEGEPIPSAGRDFRLLCAIISAGLFLLCGLAWVVVEVAGQAQMN